MVLLLVFMQLTRDLFAIAKFLLMLLPVRQSRLVHVWPGSRDLVVYTVTVPRMVPHVLDFWDIRNKYFVASTMKDVFEQVSMRNVLNVIKETHFYNLL